MNDLAKVTRNGRNHVISLPEAFEVEESELRVRREGRNLVFEPVDQDTAGSERIPPGYYTPETLPPLSEGAKAILASIDAVAPLVDIRGETKGIRKAPRITIEDEGVGIDLSDEGIPGIDPDR